MTPKGNKQNEMELTLPSKISPLRVEVEDLHVTERKETKQSEMNSIIKDLEDTKFLNEFVIELLHIVFARKEDQVKIKFKKSILFR